MRATLFRGGSIEVAAAPSGEILVVGPEARTAAGAGAEVVEVRRQVWPGLQDAHLHLSPMAMRRLRVELTGSRSLDDCLARVRRRAEGLPRTAWIRGRGWYNDDWPDPAFPHRGQLDRAAGGRPAFLVRKDGHSAWVSSAALAIAGIGRETPDPAGGVIDRDSGGDPTGIVREKAVEVIRKVVPEPTDAELDRGLASTLRDLARLGLTSVQSMDRAREFAALQRLREAGRLPIRITYNLPYADLAAAERMGLRSGWGDAWLRIWGVKAFLDGSLGSRTAEMLDGTGVPVLEQGELADREWPRVTGNAYAWGALERAGARLAFGSDAPVETADPLAGMDAAVHWRERAEWYPGLSVSHRSALRAYTSGAAYAAGMEK